MSGIPTIPFDLTQVFTAAEYAAPGPRTMVDRPFIGQRYTDSRTGKRYEFVKNVDTIAKVAGDIVFTSFAAGLSTDVDELGGSGTGASQMKGVAMGAIPASGGTGWVQTWGDHDTANVIGHASMALGASLKGSSGQSYAAFDAVVATEPAYRNHLVIRTAYTTVSAALKPVTIRCE
jgi:hypothetical protein